jgi:hypothetical protein
MNKIPTLFVRDFASGHPERLTREVHPDCGWVIAGEGVATRKYDGVCMRFTEDGLWWARREVKPGKPTPAGYVPTEMDEVTGKTVGWEPLSQSAFAKFHAEALANEYGIVDDYGQPTPRPGTYELCGPRVNGNPEQVPHHMLIRHGYTAAVDWDEMNLFKARDFNVLQDWLLGHTWEGLVFHHPDGRMAKIKRRDFRP